MFQSLYLPRGKGSLYPFRRLGWPPDTGHFGEEKNLLALPLGKLG
jgi:hypothetical protein